MSDRDLPEGVIDAAPAGGWESGASADAQTAEQNRDAAGSPALTDDGSRADEPAGTAGSQGPVEGTGPDVDPDLSSDEES